MREYTVKEIAEILKVSKPTVQRAINTSDIRADREERQKRFYNKEKTREIIRIIEPLFDFEQLEELKETETSTEKPKNSTEKPQQKTEKPKNDAEQTEKPHHNEELELLKNVIDMLQKQLEIKDKQIEEYAALLKEAHELNKGQQYLNAADKQAQIMDKYQEEEKAAANMEIKESKEEIKKDGLFAKLLGFFS